MVRSTEARYLLVQLPDVADREITHVNPEKVKIDGASFQLLAAVHQPSPVHYTCFIRTGDRSFALADDDRLSPSTLPPKLTGSRFLLLKKL
jgi:hypothetical protein